MNDTMTLPVEQSPTQESIEELLRAAAADDPAATWRLLSHVYHELKVVAHGTRRYSSPTVGPGTTELLHDSFLRLFETAAKSSWDNRKYFFGAAMRAVRNVWLDHLREQCSRVRGGGVPPAELEDHMAITVDAAPHLDVEALQQCLQELEEKFPDAYMAFQCRFFGRLTLPETAELLNIASTTVGRRSELARAWLAARLRP